MSKIMPGKPPKIAQLPRLVLIVLQLFFGARNSLELRVLIVLRSRSKRQRQRPDPAKRVGSGLRSQIAPKPVVGSLARDNTDDEA